jgi:squalene-associated FAD-dependent desaturase
MARTVHIIGAGLAGLAAAVRLARSGANIVVHEATDQPGGRCRSYHDRAVDLVIDNGNHLVLSGNHAVLSFVRAIGSADRLQGPGSADFPFVDLATGERWTLRINGGRLPWWIFDANRRIPGTEARNYLSMARLLWPKAGGTVGEAIACDGPLYQRLVRPLLLAALNIEPRDGSAALAAAVLRETLAVGGQACRPLIAREGLGQAFIEPALAYLKAQGVTVRLRHELRGLRCGEAQASQLDFGDDAVGLSSGDTVILAVPPYAASALVPDLRVPTEFRAIVNAHFRVDMPAQLPPMIGLVNATVEWIFAFPDRLSVTISAADRLLDIPRAELAHTIWREVSQVTGLPDTLPTWQIVRERRATFAATPEQNARRPGAQTRWSNLLLAGDWTATGLPATLESAIRSGHRAAELVERSSLEAA